MECVRDEINPWTGLRYGACQCEGCAEEQRELRIVDEAERRLRALVLDLLDIGWTPNEIATRVRERAPKRSRAWMLARIELTCQAGHWLSRPDRFDHLDEADELSKHTGFQVGVTIPGWMREWFRYKGGGDVMRLVDSVRHVEAAVVDVLTPSIAPTRTQRPRPD